MAYVTENIIYFIYLATTLMESMVCAVNISVKYSGDAGSWGTQLLRSVAALPTPQKHTATQNNRKFHICLCRPK